MGGGDSDCEIALFGMMDSRGCDYDSTACKAMLAIRELGHGGTSTILQLGYSVRHLPGLANRSWSDATRRLYEEVDC